MRIIHLACAALLAACAGARPAFAQTEAEVVVQALHDAHNRRDAAALLTVYAPDAVLVTAPADTVARGAEEIARAYKTNFQLMPRLQVEVRAHRAEGNTVVDELFWSGFPCGGTLSESVTFQVEGGRIRSAVSTPLHDDVVAMMLSGGGPVCFPDQEGSGKANP
jgi:uncharacterized protein (TIGR02246 family)